MIFSSLIFFIFFFVYFLLHRYGLKRHRLALIITGSTIFYGYWNIYYTFIPHLLSLFAFFCIRLQKRNISYRKELLWFTIAGLLAPLIVFKYTNFFYNLFNGNFDGNELSIFPYDLPLGISFVTFTLIAYVVDVYQDKYPEEKSFAKLLAFVLFFPQLVAGPILRPTQLLPQIQKVKHLFSSQKVYGLVLFTIGMVKKIVFSDQIADLVDKVYANPAAANAFESMLAFYGYACQIYCDFSGYTDMAIGSAILLGFRLPENFKQPYQATSIIEFWRRWHITLSFWLRDYLYIPLGGNRVSLVRKHTNLLVTMLLGGLWHGANLTFVVWGGLHGLALVVAHQLKLPFLSTKLGSWVSYLATIHFVCFAWIFFRAQSFSDAMDVIQRPWMADWPNFMQALDQNALIVFLLAVFFLTHAWDRHSYVRYLAKRIPQAILWPVLISLWTVLISFASGSSAKFIYFDF